MDMDVQASRSGEKSKENISRRLLRASTGVPRKDKAAASTASAIFAGAISTAGLLSMAYGVTTPGPLGTGEIVFGGTAMLIGLVVAVMPKTH